MTDEVFIEKAKQLEDESAMAIMRWGLDPETLTKVARLIATKEVEWNMSLAEGEDYDFWIKVHEKLQR
jgi:hypothetical protein